MDGARTGADAADAQLRDAGLRVTPARVAVVQVVGETDEHLSAEEIAARVAVLAPDVHRATVFRTLERLADRGMLTHVHVPHAPTTYHLRRPDDRMHLHVVCRVCDSVLDVDATLLDAAAERLAESSGFILDSAHAALSGTCSNCTSTPVVERH
jgi:Fur family ferric uptake transcriptional regulator